MISVSLLRIVISSRLVSVFLVCCSLLFWFNYCYVSMVRVGGLLGFSIRVMFIVDRFQVVVVSSIMLRVGSRVGSIS